MTAFNLYLLLKMDTISCIIGILSIPLWILFVICCIIIIDGFSIKEKHKRYGKDDADYLCGEANIKASIKPMTVFFITAFILSTISALIPSTKQMAAIIVVPKVISSIESNKELMALPGEITSLASAWIKELKPKSDTTSTEGE